jgi:anti-anti-sigma factor
MALDLARERHGGVLVLALSGRLDNDNAGDFQLAVQEALAAGERHLVLDLAGLSYLSNAGLRTLGRLAKSLATPTTSLRIAGLSPALRQVFEAAGATVLFEVYPSRAAALAGHPASRGAALAGELCRLLGIAAPVAPVEPAAADTVTLAELALEILTTRGRQTRAVRALAQGTQVMQRVVPTAASAPPPSRPGFWRRLFGRR